MRVETAEGAHELALIARHHENEALIRLTEINPRTVQKHLERIYEKLGVETRAAAAAMAICSGGN
jgi:DNA-binding CsgD family transcriptional regulator